MKHSIITSLFKKDKSWLFQVRQLLFFFFGLQKIFDRNVHWVVKKKKGKKEENNLFYILF